MDAFISPEAIRAVSASAQAPLRSPSDGLLIGHKRGPRFIIEEILPGVEKGRLSSEKMESLHRILDEEIIGFITFNSKNSKGSSFLSPWAYGKLILAVRVLENNTLSLKAFVVDYKKRFYLKEIKIETPSPKK